MTVRKTAKSAQSTESATSKPAALDVTTITFRGEEFTFPADRAQWPTLAMQQLQRKLNADAVETLFGPEQWARLNEVAPLLGEFYEFFKLFLKAAGFTFTEQNDD